MHGAPSIGSRPPAKRFRLSASSAHVQVRVGAPCRARSATWVRNDRQGRQEPSRGLRPAYTMQWGAARVPRRKGIRASLGSLRPPRPSGTAPHCTAAPRPRERGFEAAASDTRRAVADGRHGGSDSSRAPRGHSLSPGLAPKAGRERPRVLRAARRVTWGISHTAGPALRRAHGLRGFETSKAAVARARRVWGRLHPEMAGTLQDAYWRGER